MSLIASAIRAAERTPLPDSLARMGIDFLVGRTKRKLAAQSDRQDDDFARAMAAYPVATFTEAANAQHYELPPEFFALTLGPARKYSCCLYPEGRETLDEAERLALEETIAHADLTDGHSILELGCGWGSLTLFMAERYPRSTITAVSNAKPQRLYIEAQARARGLDNIRVVTADMNAFTPDRVYDRVVSVEMFEHMSNWRVLLARIKTWLVPEQGRLFIHVFSHRHSPYRFDHRNDADWIAQHFFTGGIMPSHGLIRHFPDCFTLEKDWRWSGLHYQKTALDWLARFDAERSQIDQILNEVYGSDAALWRQRWRLFYLATAGLFGHADGEEWGVSHYLMRPT
ncbi:SAM-dependent methyltransferase [Chelatococcus asaccharovorans]|uniref:SAM-dependent methyltransferase n=1 Tax=Chelatococcus asaccharovorans TaxID=28210 RepID=UPI00224C65B8|nr:cyclopropane-fatty-acyl-phospholipid synthase family protein [Chelatococcus asaccharovorans]CAH1669507.1 Cyclopropane-fatty-acyl-phospholipid synthase [Chelatococcus asaccharovorans]CAH1679058.1 Cyclopropane-fatty-acyl-phospholipid synthase [Chelatococcus asaccharovorans]